MKRLTVGRMAIIIAHCLSTLPALDCIPVFDRGRITEDGGHATLLAQTNGVYRYANLPE